MPFEAVAVANHFLEQAKAEGQTLNPMKVQKLVYFAHGWHLAIYDRPLLLERVEAWKYGPVVRELYHELKEFGSGPITKPITVLRFDRKPESRIGASVRIVVPFMDAEGDPDSAAAATAVVDRVLKVYGRYSAVQLSNATHVEGSPWDITWKQCKGERNTVIDDELIKADFKRRAQAHLAQQTEAAGLHGGTA
jgi:uncharacterized phage-associated protein